ncbi:unnamed protein product [Peniophora sp. CBMAI 1063]|nr:unnamed protein product [Peniophora sp. CBMAI 1063]
MTRTNQFNRGALDTYGLEVSDEPAVALRLFPFTLSEVMVHPTADVKSNLGAILLGGLLSMALSGVVACQGFLYFRMYGQDSWSIKGLVLLVWALDAVHTSLIATSLWNYFALGFGDASQTDLSDTELALTIAFTAMMNFVVHIFFSHRVWKLSRSNLLVTGPLIILSICRLVSGIASTVRLDMIRSFSTFVDIAGWNVTLGLSLSAALDILIAGAMCYYLQNIRSGFSSEMDHTIDILLLYTFNNGALTCVATVSTLICWLAMPENLIWLGMHFAISKLYATSLLISLNTRRWIRQRSQKRSDGSSHQMPVRFPTGTSISFGQRSRSVMPRFAGTATEPDPTTTVLSVRVEKTVQFDISSRSELAELEASESRRKQDGKDRLDV